ncbi:MAG: autotransporter outer membrane beta-barrel domain-containing protein [Planctomycetaceae bacterium]|nr:autotransporter outer membrane beta-barrel domain-containing protein [Planctomycetaceae bacterium]
MRYLTQSMIPAILTIVGLLILARNVAATPVTATSFEKVNPFGIQTEDFFDQSSDQLPFFNQSLDQCSDQFDQLDQLFDHPFFSANVDCYLGQKRRQRGSGGRIWTNLYYGNTVLEPKGMNAKIKPNLFGLQVGLDIVQSHGVYKTFFGNFNQSKTKYPDQTNADTENYLLGYGKYIYLNGCHFGGAGSLGYDRYKIRNSSYQINAKGDGLQCNLFGEFGLDFILGQWGIKPFYALQYDFLYHGRIGQASVPVREDWNGHGLSQFLGIRFNWKLFESFELQSRLTWIHELLDNPPVYYHARFSAVQGTGSPAVLFYEGNTGRDWAWIGFGLKLEGVYNVFLFLDYDLMINARHTTHLGNLGLCFGW